MHLLKDVEQAIAVQGQIARRVAEAKRQTEASLLDEKLAEVCRDVLSWLRGWVALGKRAAIGEGCVLYWVERLWDELTPFHAHYGSFDRFAREETGEEYSTYRQKMEIYRVFVLNETGSDKIAGLGPRLLDVPVGKLQKAVARVRRNQMDDEQWAALLDEGVSDAEFRHIISRTPEERAAQEQAFLAGRVDPQVTIDMVTGKLTLWRGVLGVEIGSLDVHSRDEMVREVVDRIIDGAGIRRR